ncbi:MAG: hypothetical protein E7559_01145 [Ruminococcaceae bacterium]|nr:hypothetical protein [Oscillospiraceae bacterium]
MLRKCTEAEFQKYIDFAYGLAADPTRSGYPSYSDGIKTKEMFIARAEKALSRDTEDILLFECGGEVEGWIHYYHLPEDKYLSTVSFNVRRHIEQALDEFVVFAQGQFQGCELILGFPAENKAAACYLTSHGFECIEESINTTGYPHKWEPVAADSSIVRVTQDNYALFRQLHAAADEDMYWNSDRIFAALENWTIFVKLRDGKAAGSVYYTAVGDGWFEIFGIDMRDNAFDKEICRSLLAAAMNSAKAQGGRYMTFFCGDEEQKVADKLGFMCVGRYVCYRKQL